MNLSKAAVNYEVHNFPDYSPVRCASLSIYVLMLFVHKHRAAASHTKDIYV